MTHPFVLTPRGAEWLGQIFAAKAAREGGVIRRKTSDVDRMVGRKAFLTEMRRRGFGVVENAGQYVIFCNREELRRLA
ncbi:MAG: N-(5'-phosphoribosyl)anthranilate isomerase [Pseudomonadota bacterium]